MANPGPDQNHELNNSLEAEVKAESTAALSELKGVVQNGLDRPEELLRDAIKQTRTEVRTEMAALGSLVETKNASPEAEAEQLTNDLLGKSKEWNDRRNDGTLARQAVDKSLTGHPLLSGQKSMDTAIANTEKEMGKRGFGFERSQFNKLDDDMFA